MNGRRHDNAAALHDADEISDSVQKTYVLRMMSAAAAWEADIARREALERACALFIRAAEGRYDAQEGGDAGDCYAEAKSVYVTALRGEEPSMSDKTDADRDVLVGLKEITPAALRMFSSGPKGFLARCAATWDADISRRVALERLYSQSRLFFVAKRVLEGALDLGDLRIAVEEHGALLEEKP